MGGTRKEDEPPRVNSNKRITLYVLIDIKSPHYADGIALEEAARGRVVVAGADVEKGQFLMRLISPSAGVAVAVFGAVD